MEAKLNKIDELSKFLSNKNALSRDLMSLCKRFRMSKIMSNSGIEKQKGIQSTALLLFLLIIRICGMTKFQLYQNKYFELIDRIVGKNCMYRFVNNPKWSWRSLLYGGKRIRDASCLAKKNIAQRLLGDMSLFPPVG